MSPASFNIVEEDFIDAVNSQIKSQPCYSITKIKELREKAVQKTEKHDMRDLNLLFPPDLLKKYFSKERIESVLGCKCAVCKHFLGDDDARINSNLVKKLTEPNGDDARRFFSVLLFMGAGFTARQLCLTHATGLDITLQEEKIRKLFLGVQNHGLWPHNRNIASRFITIFNQARRIFEVPRFEVGKHDTMTTYSFNGHENLPFLNENPLGIQDSNRAQLRCFEIHHEFRGESIPRRLVRKEIEKVNPHEETVLGAISALKLLDKSKKLHFVNPEFSYVYDGKVNYVFRKYAGSLQDVLSGKQLTKLTRKPLRFQGSRLQHWLWQGAVDIVEALAFLHSWDFVSNSSRGPSAAAHFDIKPANVLVDDDGSLVLTDFGDARIVNMGDPFKTSGGDYNYSPPSNPRKGSDMIWSQAYDVWSMACVLTEVIEYINSRDGPGAVADLRKDRKIDNPSNSAFWMRENGDYKLRPSVDKALKRFKSAEDQYLKHVTDLLERMFSVQESKRPSMAECFAQMSQIITTDPSPELDEGQTFISDLGTKMPLRNMLTRFERKIENSETLQGCKMYMSLDESSKRMRLVLQVEKSLEDGKTVKYLDSSARCEEEGLKLLSPLSRDPLYNIESRLISLCEFEVMHHNRKLIFDVPEDYYHFVAAVTRQELYRQHDKNNAAEVAKFVHMPIKRCVVNYSAFWAGNRVQYNGGHVQIWRELSDVEYNTLFMPSKTTPTLGNRRESNLTTKSSSSGASTARERTIRSSKLTRPRRVVIFLPGTSSRRCLTINIANGISELQFGLNSSKTKSPKHMTMKKTSKGDFLIGKFESESGFPAIPLDPGELRKKENLKVDWVEIEFTNDSGLNQFHTLCFQNDHELLRL